MAGFVVHTTITHPISVLKSRAYTFIELLAIVLFFTIPFGLSLHQKNQIQVVHDDIKSAIRYAKTQALTTGNNVILTPLMDSNDWSDGVILFIDNAKHHYTQDDKLIHEWHWQTPGIHIEWNGYQSNRYLLFSADASQNVVNGTFSITSNSKYHLSLVINKLGRIKRSN